MFHNRLKIKPENNICTSHSSTTPGKYLLHRNSYFDPNKGHFGFGLFAEIICFIAFLTHLRHASLIFRGKKNIKKKLLKTCS